MKELTEENYFDSIKSKEHPVAIMVKASWCSNCKALAPVFEKIANEMEDKAHFYYLTVDDKEQLARSLKIMGVPTLLFYRYGVLVDKKLGNRSSNSIKKIIESLTTLSEEEANRREYRSLFRRLFGRK